MDSYEILWKHSAEQDLRKIDRQYIPQIIKVIESLATNPFPPQHQKLRSVEHFYRLRVGDYIRHRKDVYRGL